MIGGGCWIFLSHSSHDIQKVRMIRNEFEQLGHNPLAFYLRCLSDDTEEGKQELDSLIEREIEARNWFVYCDSPEAERSPYVQLERDYIEKIGKENVWRIDMRQDDESIKRDVLKICVDIRVFVSYAYKDKPMATVLANVLADKDYSVWMDEYDVKPGDDLNDFRSIIAKNIRDCVETGFFLFLITNQSVRPYSPCFDELYYAFEVGATIIPVIIGDPVIPAEIQCKISNLPKVFLAPGSQDFTPVLNLLDNEVKKKLF